MKRLFFSVMMTMFLVLSLGLVTAVAVSAQTDRLVPSEYATIQLAVDASNPGDTISVASGEYIEDLDITTDNLELVGTDATLKGVATSTVGDAPAIEILADGVRVHGFTVEAPDRVIGEYFSGIFIDGTDVEIYDNHFVGSPAMQVEELSLMVATYETGYSPTLEPTDVSGLHIHNNVFTGYGDFGASPVYVMSHIGSGSILIDSNTLEGAINIGITVEADNAVVSNNTLSTTLDTETAPYGTYGIRFMEVHSPVTYTNLTASGNDVSGFKWAIRVGNSSVGSTFSTTVSSNKLDVGNTYSIRGRQGNDITAVDNSLSVVLNEDTTATITIDARNNWWGQSSGLSEGAIVGNVDTDPWLLAEGGTHYEYTRPLPAGWSIISPDAELESWGTGETELMYAYDGGWVSSFILDPVTPIFVKTTNGGGVGFNYTESSQGIFTTDLEAGWNLIGVPQTYADPGDILSPIRFGANNEVALATLVSQGNYNPSDEPSFYMSMLDEEVPAYLLPFDGYWAYMNVAKEFGVIVVPVPD